MNVVCSGFHVYERSFHEKLAPSHLKNGGTSMVPIRFNKSSALEIAKVLNISMAISGRFVGALELRNKDIIISEHMKEYMEDDAVAIDFEYFGIQTIDDE